LRTTIIAALVCVPVAATAQTLVVEYQGTVSSIDRAAFAEDLPYSIGDPISGSLMIETHRAPADELTGDSSIGRYYGGSPGIDFILGPPNPDARTAADLVLVYDDWLSEDDALTDGFLISDRSIGNDGEFNLVLGMQRPTLLGQLFTNDGLEQSFDVEREPGIDLWGYIERGFGELYRSVSFTLDRFSVSAPGVCRS
jgi:hypothetical protein